MTTERVEARNLRAGDTVRAYGLDHRVACIVHLGQYFKFKMRRVADERWRLARNVPADETMTRVMEE